MSGWIKIHRQLAENDLWTCEPFSRGQAWVDMILLANHKPNFFYKRGVKVSVDRGQLAWSELALSERWRWSRNKVRKFLKDLEKEHQIEQQKTNVTQVVTIKNYDKYQEKDNRRNTKRTPKGHQKDTNKNEEELIKNEKNIPSLDEFLLYAFQQKKTLNKEVVEAKYKSWVENGWKDGYHRDIKNWKSKLLNTIPHMKEDKPQEKVWTPPKLKEL